jgi:hypothetical protein
VPFFDSGFGNVYLVSVEQPVHNDIRIFWFRGPLNEIRELSTLANVSTQQVVQIDPYWSLSDIG